MAQMTLKDIKKKNSGQLTLNDLDKRTGVLKKTEDSFYGETAVDTALGGFTRIGVGAIGFTENITDFAQYRVADASDLFGFKNFAQAVRNNANFDGAGWLREQNEAIYDRNLIKEGSLGAQITEGVGQVGFMLATGKLLPKPLQNIKLGKLSMPTTAVVGGMGRGESTGRKMGATGGELATYTVGSGLISGTVEGLGGMFGQYGADTFIANKLSERVTKEGAKWLIDLAVKSGFEGLEEPLEGYLETKLQQATINPDATYTLQDAWNDFIVGTSVGTIMQGGSTVNNVMAGTPYKTEKQLDAEANYEKLREKEKNIGEMTETELKQYIEDVIEAERQLQEVYKKTNDNIPTKENVSEKGIKKEIIAPIESGIKVEKVGTPLTLEESIQKYFDTTDPKVQELQKTLQGLQKVRGLEIMFDDSIDGNGLIQTFEDGRRIVKFNPNSDKVLEKTIIHEFYHDLNQEDRLALQQIVSEFDQSKEGFEEARESLRQLYEDFYDKKGLDKSTLNIDEEATADILGEMLGNKEFVDRLAIEKPSLFMQFREWLRKIIQELEIAFSSNKEQKRFLYNLEAQFEQAYRKNYVKQQESIKNSIEAKSKMEQQNDKYELNNIYEKIDKYIDKNLTYISETTMLNNEATFDIELDKANGEKVTIKTLATDGFWDGNYDIESYTKTNKKNNNINKAFENLETLSKKLEKNKNIKSVEVEKSEVSDSIYLNIKLTNGESLTIRLSDHKRPMYSDGMATYEQQYDIEKIDNLFEFDIKKLENEISDKIDSEPKIQGLENYTKQEIKDMTLNHIEQVINESGENVDIIGLEIIGSRSRGNAKKSSDLDVVVEYKGNIREDSLFNMLNEEQLVIDGVKVDINPITASKTGTLESYMKQSNAYDREVLKNQDSTGKTLSKQTAEYFKDSKVRDDKGRLLEVYHSTNSEFNEFDTKKIGSATDDGIWGMGFYFANKDTRNVYGKNLKKVYLNIKNPLIMSDFKSTEEIADYLDMSESNFVIDNTYGIPRVVYSQTRQFTSQLQLKGHDGVIAKSKDGWTEYVAFEPNQIKDSSNIAPTKESDIRYSLSEDNDLQNKYSNLNLNENISNLDGVPAIELNDGSILPIKTSNTTHVMFIEKNNIDVNDIRSGGWIGEGIYNATERSDTMRYVEKQQANQRAEAKRNIAPTVVKDNKGRTLTKEQQNYFKNSKVVDSDGKLLTVYHGTTNGGFNVFDNSKLGSTTKSVDSQLGFHFTDNQELGKLFTDETVFANDNAGSNKEVKETYLNITKPFNLNNLKYISEIEKNDTFVKDLYYALTGEKITNKTQLNEMRENLLSSSQWSSTDQAKDEIVSTNGAIDRLKELGYDGIIKEIQENDILALENIDAENVRGNEYIVFNSNQIKNVTNTNPTSDEDIRLSQSQDGKWQDRLDTLYNFNVKPGTMLGNIRLTDKQAQILSERPKQLHPSIPSEMDRIIQKTVNRGHYVDKLAKATGNKELTFKYDKMLSSMAEGHYVVGVAQTDNNGKVIGKSVNKIWKPVENSGKVQEFSEYLLHKHNIDRMAQGKPVFGEQVTADMSKKIVQDYESSNPEFVEWAKDINTFNKNQLQNMVDAGLTSVETQELLNNMYDNYVKIQREISGTAPITNQYGRLKVNSPIKKAKGGNQNILPLKDSMAGQAIEIKNAIRRNDFGLELYKTIGGEKSTDFDIKKLVDNTDGNYTLTVFEKGQPVRIKIDEGLYESMKPKQVADWENLAPVQGVQKLARLQRSLLTVDNPLFVVTNFFKDFQDGMFNSKYSKKFIPNYMEAINQIKNNGELWQLYQANGGNQNTYFDYDKGVTKEPTGIKKFIEKIRNANEIVEQAPRLAEFISTIQDGKSITEAMYNASEITTNFKRGGDITKAINRNGANFLNASVQGFDKQIRNVTGANGFKGYVNLLSKATILGVLPAVLNHMLLGDDEEYEDLPFYIKDNFFLFKVGDGKFIRIPKGRVLSIFGSAARRTLEFAGGDEKAFEGFLKNVQNQVAPNNPLEDNILAPILNAKDNKTWHGGDLVPQRLQDELPKNQWDERTDAFSKWLGEQLNISPIKINYVLDQYSGGIGDVLLPLTTPRAEQNPLSAKFSVDSVMTNKNVQDFFAMKEKLTKVANDRNATDEEKLMVKFLNREQAKANTLYAEKREIELSDMKDSEKRKAVREIQTQINSIMENALDNYENVEIGGNYARIGDYEWYRKDGEWQSVSSSQQNKDLDKLGFDKNDYYTNYTKLNSIRYDDTLDNDTKRSQIIDNILKTDLSSEQKLFLYNNYYSSEEKINAITKVGIEAELYLQLEKNIIGMGADDDPNSNIAGRTISGSKKAKIVAEIQKLPTTRNNKLVLYGMQGYGLTPSEKTEVFNYINGKQLTANEKKEIIEQIKSFQWLENGNLRGW